MNSVWTVQESRGVDRDLLKITETREVAENYVRDRFLLHIDSTNEWVVTADQPDLKVWADVVTDEFVECEDMEDYFDDRDCAYLIIEKWNVLKAN